MARATDIINKILGAGMSMASMGFFIASFSHGGAPVAIVPAVLFAGGGFWLIARKEAPPALQPEVQQRMERLADVVANLQNELAATQERVDRLDEERDFMRKLGTPPRAPGRPPAPGPTTPAGSSAS
ncbi:MAG TPA: hypothetical protein VF832_17390 [Longimicrobiales bacterium]